jgi:hypothetical protein
MTLDEVVSALKNRFDADAVFSEHQEIIFVAHSLGGLVVQRLLLTYPTLVPSTKLIYFFSTPESGSGVARYARIFNSDPLIGELRSGPRNDYLESLEDSWRAATGVGSLMTRCAYETKKTHHVLVVDRLSATRMCPIGTTLPIPKDHISIVKPCSVKDDAYIALNNAVREIPKGQQSAAADTLGGSTAPGIKAKDAAPIPAPPQQTVNIDHGIGGIGGTYINPTVNNNSDRQLTANQIAFFPTRIAPLATVWISCSSGDAEQIQLATQLQPMLVRAGWDSRLGARQLVEARSFRGIEVRSSERLATAADELVAALNSVGLGATRVPRGTDDFAVDGVSIVIGAKSNQ